MKYRSHKRPVRRRGAPLGQHFLTNTSVADAIVEAASVAKNDEVLEVGPGKGILTGALLKAGARVTAIEKDPTMIAILKRTFTKEIQNKTLVLYEQDVRDFLQPSRPSPLTPLLLQPSPFNSSSLRLSEPNGLPPSLSSLSNLPPSTFNLQPSYKVVANIPYYITGELIRLFLTAEKQPDTLVFLVQKEVAERVARSKKESILSLSVKAYGTPRYVKTVKAGNFSPPPSVDSAILSITDISRKNFTPIYGCTEKEMEERFFVVVKAGFGQKRKMLAGNLKRAFGERALHALDEAGIARDARAEDIPLAPWLLLSQKLQQDSWTLGMEPSSFIR